MSAPFVSIASPQHKVRVLFYLVRRFTPEGMKKEGVHMIGLPSDNADALKVNTLLSRNQITNREWTVIFDLVWRKFGVRQQSGATGYIAPQVAVRGDADQPDPDNLNLSMVYPPIAIPASHFAPYQAILKVINTGNPNMGAVATAGSTYGLSADEAGTIYDELDRYLGSLHIAPLVPLDKSELDFTRN